MYGNGGGMYGISKSRPCADAKGDDCLFGQFNGLNVI